MKTWFIALPLLCAVGFAMAEGVATKATANQTQTPAGQSQMAKPKHPPRGDLRYCLELKTNEAIIRCSERKPRK